ncbi:MAG: 1-acyl-sn-glycerol-3-phosphate acyltransferase [Clostridia bacterium]|nr:1-acyl-sn-glycerol-3-phosphate acyltransferase [Clostridia bacterium]
MKRNLDTEFKKRKIKKPNKLLAKIVCWAFGKIAKKRNATVIYQDDYLSIKDKQIVYLCQHKSRDDYFYVFSAINRTDVHVLCGYQNIFKKFIYGMMKKLGVIAKYLYQPDIQATKQTFEAVKLGDSIVIFPEGIQSTSGSTHPINPATIKLLKKLKLPVALVTLKGSYFTRTRYSTDVKKGKITVTLSKLFDSEDFVNQTEDQLNKTLLSKFEYDEFEEFSKEKVEFIGKKPNITGLNNIIYKCPHCNNEGCFEIENDTMTCKDCGFKIKMDNYYDIFALNKELPFKNIDEWYKWQRLQIHKQIKDDNFALNAKIQLGVLNTKKLTDNRSLLYVGEGELTLTNKGLTYKGTKNGENVELFFEAKAVYSLTITLLHELDLYYKNDYYNFKLLENQMLMTKWMLAAEEIHNLYDDAWKKVSEEVYFN